MAPREINVKVFAVLLNEAGDGHLVWRGSDGTRAQPDFHRLLGGHLEPGESTVDGVRREILEETGVQLLDASLLGVLENRFVFEEEPGHEIVFVYGGRLESYDGVPAGGAWLADNGRPIWVEWRPVVPPDTALPLYPDGVQGLINQL
jgi:ADP-ribose pyrophosphatase YjhB (NUDIX family)